MQHANTEIIYFTVRSGNQERRSKIRELTERKISVTRSWASLIAKISDRDNAALIIIDSDLLQNSTVSIPEIINSISTIYNCSCECTDALFAVLVRKTCTMQFIKELKIAGVIGIVPASHEFGECDFQQAVEILLTGKPHWPKPVISQLSGFPRVKPKHSPEIKITSRQSQILTLMCNRGLPNKSIAAVLKISESTVKVHVGAIMKSYGVQNRTQLVLAASQSLKA